MNLIPQLAIISNREEIWWFILIKIYIGVVLQETIYTKIRLKQNIKFSMHYTHLVGMIFFSCQIVQNYYTKDIQDKEALFDLLNFKGDKNILQVFIGFLHYKTIVVQGVFGYNLLITILTNMKLQYSIYAFNITALFVILLDFNIFVFLFYLGLFWTGFFFLNKHPHRRDQLIIDNIKLKREINIYYNKYFQKDLFYQAEIGVIDEHPKLRIPLL